MPSFVFVFHGRPFVSGSARHRVYRATYDGEECVLKEHELSEASRLAKEVRGNFALCTVYTYGHVYISVYR